MILMEPENAALTSVFARYANAIKGFRGLPAGRHEGRAGGRHPQGIRDERPFHHHMPAAGPGPVYKNLGRCSEVTQEQAVPLRLRSHLPKFSASLLGLARHQAYIHRVPCHMAVSACQHHRER